jgi:hypothetical protein
MNHLDIFQGGGNKILRVKCIVILFSLVIVLSCGKNILSDNEMNQNQDTYSLLFSSGHDYNLENQIALENFDINNFIDRRLPNTQHVDFFSYYSQGILFVTTEDKDSEKVQENRILYYLNENKQLKNMAQFKAIYPSSFYLQNNYLFCLTYSELVAIDIEAGVILWRKEVISNGTPSQLYVDIEKDIYILGYEKYGNEIKIINLSNNSDIKIFKGIIVCFDCENKKIYYKNDNKYQLFVYDYNSQETEQLKLVDKTNTPHKDYELYKVYFAAENKLILDYLLHQPVLVTKFLFPWADAYIDYHYYYTGKLNEKIIEKHDVFSIPEKENTSKIMSIRFFNNMNESGTDAINNMENTENGPGAG